MRILVTGGAGYIGSHATRLFLERGHEVTVYDNLCHGHRSAVPPDVLVVGDLANRPFLEQVLREKAIEAVVHFAAFCYVGESVQDPEKYYQNNLVGTINLLAAMRSTGVPRLVFSSTCATYGIPERVPITEDARQAPINPYGRAKLAAELIMSDYAQAYGLSFAALRYFNAAGAHPSGALGEDHDPETHLIPLVIQAAMKKRAYVEVCGTDYPTPDGTCIRDYVHVLDLAEAHLLALERLVLGRRIAVNLGTGTGYSVREVIRTCETVTGCVVPVKEGARRPGDPPVLVAAPQKAMAELGWRPRFPDLRAIVATAWEWHRLHPDGYGDRRMTPGDSR